MYIIDLPRLYSIIEGNEFGQILSCSLKLVYEIQKKFASCFFFHVHKCNQNTFVVLVSALANLCQFL